MIPPQPTSITLIVKRKINFQILADSRYINRSLQFEYFLYSNSTNASILYKLSKTGLVFHIFLLLSSTFHGFLDEWNWNTNLLRVPSHTYRVFFDLLLVRSITHRKSSNRVFSNNSGQSKSRSSFSGMNNEDNIFGFFL